MSDTNATVAESTRGSSWKWGVCGLLMLATMLNYMDRLTLNQTATLIKAEMHLNHEQYGEIEEAFGIAFALGALLVGWMVDHWNVRWIYPAALLGWSAAGFATGFAQTLTGLLWCRFFLGLLEAGNWPCALRATQHFLPAAQRTLGNGILQSGAAFGAILTPQVVLALVDERNLRTWRYPFFVIGALGIAWAVLWLGVVRSRDLALSSFEPVAAVKSSANRWSPLRSQARAVAPLLGDRRFWVLVVVVVVINTTWHYFRVWLPLFLQESRDYSFTETGRFMTVYYFATDLGSLGAGFAALFLTRHHWSVHRSRLVVFCFGALLTLLSPLAAVLPKGPWLLGVLLLIGFGSLGMFPVYYSLTQEITVRHQGKVNGMLGCINWVAMSQLHPLVGRIIDQDHSYDRGVALVGAVPLLGLLALWLFWKEVPQPDAGLGSNHSGK